MTTPEGKLRLGGMALRNGLLVHGPTHWAAAVRTKSGELKVASGPKPDLGGRASERIPGVRGITKLAEAMAVIPLVKFVSDKRKMGEFVIPRWVSAIAWIVAGPTLPSVPLVSKPCAVSRSCSSIRSGIVRGRSLEKTPCRRGRPRSRSLRCPTAIA